MTGAKFARSAERQHRLGGLGVDLQGASATTSVAFQACNKAAIQAWRNSLDLALEFGRRAAFKVNVNPKGAP